MPYGSRQSVGLEIIALFMNVHFKDGSMAQWLKRLTTDRRVQGSNPRKTSPHVILRRLQARCIGDPSAFSHTYPAVRDSPWGRICRTCTSPQALMKPTEAQFDVDSIWRSRTQRSLKTSASRRMPTRLVSSKFRPSPVTQRAARNSSIRSADFDKTRWRQAWAQIWGAEIHARRRQVWVKGAVAAE